MRLDEAVPETGSTVPEQAAADPLASARTPTSPHAEDISVATAAMTMVGAPASVAATGPIFLLVENDVVQSARGLEPRGGDVSSLLVGRQFTSLLHPDDQTVVRELLRVTESGDTQASSRNPIVLRFMDGEGELRYVEAVLAPVRDSSQGTGVAVHGWDITRHVRRQQSLEQMALHDPLTGLANRALFGERLQEELRRQRRTGSEVALLYMDLDGFKSVNDTWGHRAGDLLLTALAHRLRGCLRPGDTLARLGGDEFAACCPDIVDADAALVVAHRLIDAATAPVSLGGAVVRVSMSIGVALSVENDLNDSGNRMLARADLAMYAAKQTGRERVALAPVPT